MRIINNSSLLIESSWVISVLWQLSPRFPSLSFRNIDRVNNCRKVQVCWRLAQSESSNLPMSSIHLETDGFWVLYLIGWLMAGWSYQSIRQIWSAMKSARQLKQCLLYLIAYFMLQETFGTYFNVTGTSMDSSSSQMTDGSSLGILQNEWVQR